MLKRVLCVVLVSVLFVSFCFFSFSCGYYPYVLPIIANASDGEGSHRGDYIELQRADIDIEKTEREISDTFLSDLWNNPVENLDDLFCFALGSVGAIFSDDTTLAGVKNQWNAIYANALESPEEMRKIFYYGKDGQLYFTDEFIKNTRDIVDQATFNQGIISIPVCHDDELIQEYLSIGALHLTNAVTSAVSGDDLLVMPSPYYFNVYNKYWSTGFSISDMYCVANFDSYSSYKNKFCNNQSQDYTFNFRFYLSDLSEFSSFVFTYYRDKPYNGEFGSVGTYTVTAPFPICNWYSGVQLAGDNMYILGAGSFEAYRSIDWMEFYMSGGTGVLRGNTYYKLDNAINTDEMINGSAIYNQLQEHYKTLAGEVKNGTKTLSEINDLISNEILDTAKDIEQNTAVQANYLKKILNELKDISKKLTYSNVVGTVNAASNLLSSIGLALDGLFESAEDGFNLLDFVSDGLSDTMKSVFPFSLPHDLLLIYEILAVDSKIPQVDFHFELARLGIKYDYTYVADDFTKLAYITRFFSSVGFVILLINLTNKMLKR